MNKLFTKIGVAMVGLAMAVGVGTAIGHNDIKRVSAETTAEVSSDLTNSTESAKWTKSGTDVYSGDSSIKFDSSGDYILRNSLFSGTVSSGMTALSVSVYGKINGSDSNSNKFTVQGINSSGTTTGTTSFTGKIGTSYGWKTFTIESGLANTTGIKIVYTTKSSGNWGVTDVKWTATYSGAPLTPVTVTISGSLTKTSYTKSDSWSNAGLTVSGVYNTDTPYDGEFNWTFSPETPTAMGVGVDQDLTITATVISAGYSGSASKTIKVTVTPAETTGITNGEKYIIVAYSSYYFTGTISGGTGTTSANKYEGMPFTFTLVGDNKYKIKNDSDKYIAVGNDSKTLSLANSSDGLTVTLSSSYYYIKGSSNRYLCWYESSSDIRTYSSGTSYITLLSFDASEVASEIKSLSGGWSNNVQTNDCADHYKTAKARIKLLSASDLNTFKTSEDTEIASARTTYLHWCEVNGDASPWSGDIVVAGRFVMSNTIKTSSSSSIIIIVISSITLLTIAGCFMIRRRKEK